MSIKEIEPLYYYVGENKQFKTILDAYNQWVTDGKEKSIIYIYAGEYNETIIARNVAGNLSFVGENKNNVIWRTKIGYYRNAPLHIQNSYIKGITFIADHSENLNFTYTTLRGISNVWDKDCGGAYGLHVDFRGDGGETIIEDCDLISYQNAGLGCGTRKNQTIEIKNTNIYSYTDAKAIKEITRNGAMLYHTANDLHQPNQFLKMSNVNLYSKNFKALEYRVFSREKSMSKVEFNNCNFQSDKVNSRKLVHFNLRFGHMYLSNNSYGNNVNKCNYNGH